MNKVCFVHNDLDGKCAGAIAKYHDESTYVIEVDYERSLPLSKVEKNVIICDFTPKKEDFDKLVNKGCDIIWLDHHKRNFEQFPEYAGLKGIRVDTIPSGAYITWQWFFPDKEIPEAVELVSDYDTWQYNYGDRTKYFNYGTRLYNTAPNSLFWKDIFNNKISINEICNKGVSIFEYLVRENMNYLKQYGFEINFEGYKTICCNVGRQNSTFFDSVDGYDIVMTFVIRNQSVFFSIYTTKNIDLSLIASKYGGGGHPKASGFVLGLYDLETFLRKGM